LEKGQVDMGLFDARKKMIKTAMISAIEKADAIMHQGSPPYREVKRCLTLSPKQWYDLELPAAQACGDTNRAKQCKYRLWEIDMAATPGSYARWSNWQGLRTPQEYAKGKWFGKTSTAEGMCMAEKATVNQPLTKDPSPEFKRMAKEMNKSVLAYCGLKSDPRGPEQAAADALQTGARSNEAKSELYCQLFKAASSSQKVTDPAAYDKAYQLLGVAMYCFPPPDDELLKHAFIFSIKKDVKYAKACSHGKFESNGQAPRSGTEVSRIASEIDNMGREGSAI